MEANRPEAAGLADLVGRVRRTSEPSRGANSGTIWARRSTPGYTQKGSTREGVCASSSIGPTPPVSLSRDAALDVPTQRRLDLAAGTSSTIVASLVATSPTYTATPAAASATARRPGRARLSCDHRASVSELAGRTKAQGMTIAATKARSA